MKNAIDRLREALENTDAVMIGAGAGLSTAAGFVYSGERFRRVFPDFEAKYGFHDMYSGGFYPYGTREEYWAFWSRNIWINRYMDIPKPVYDDLLTLVRGKDYFVLTTNVDHCFQKVGRKNLRFSRPSLSEGQTEDIQIENLNTSPAGFDKQRLFYTQGDYGLFQCTKPCCQRTWDNEGTVREMLLAQGFVIGEGGALTLPEGTAPAMAVPPALLPKCPNCGRPLTMNLRSDDKFVEDAGWHAAAGRYNAFTRAHADDHILYLEIGVGWNTPGIIKYNFWNLAYQNPNAAYACLNFDDARVARELEGRAIAIEGDSAQVIAALAHPV